MSNMNLVRKLTLGIVVLTTLVVTVTTASIGIGIFLLTEQAVKVNMLEDGKRILTEYITVSNNEIKQKVQSDQPSLGSYLRSKDLSLLIISESGETVARYGVYHDLPNEYLVIKSDEEAKYFDKKIPSIGYVDIYTLPIVSGGEKYGHLQILRRNREADILGSTLKTVTIILLPFSWSVALFLGWMLARRVTRPISRMVSEITHLNPEQLTELKIDKEAEEEVKVVSRSINELIAKLERSYKRQSQITENISHEFKTPLTRIATNLQVKKYKEAENEAIQLGQNVDALLSLALWEKKENVESEITKILEKLMSEVPSNLRKDLRLPKQVNIGIPATHAEIIFRNIIDNAVKHNRENGYIKVIAEKDGNLWEVKVVNSAKSIPNIKKVTQRKYRGMQSHGVGIGMAIVRDLCKLYGLNLKITAQNNEVEVKISNS